MQGDHPVPTFSAAQIQPNGLAKSKNLKVKSSTQLVHPPASATAAQSHRFFQKDSNFVGSSLLQKHNNMLQSTKSGASISLPRGTQAPNHRKHLAQNESMRPESFQTQQPLTNNFVVASEQQIPPFNSNPRSAHPKLRLPSATTRSDLLRKPKLVEEQRDPHEAVQSSQDAHMQSVEDKQDRLKHFWTVTAPQVSQAEAAAIDQKDLSDPQAISEFAGTISKHLLECEKVYLPSVTYMAGQSDINEKMRAILVDWIIEVHLKFKLLPETLFLTVGLIDRYLERVSIKRGNLQLVGVTCMLVASKYEEIYAPEVQDFVYITDNAYSKAQIFEMEHSLLHTLEFDVTFPSAYRFLERFNKVANGCPKVWNLARYLIELPLIEQRMLKYRPSNLAAAAVYLSQKILLR